MGGDALFRAGHEAEGERPFVEWDMRGLHHGSDCDRELFFAGAAFPDAGPVSFALKLRRLVDDAASRANRAIRPMKRLEIFPGGVLVVKNRAGQIDGGHRGGTALIYLKSSLNNARIGLGLSSA